MSSHSTANANFWYGERREFPEEVRLLLSETTEESTLVCAFQHQGEALASFSRFNLPYPNRFRRDSNVFEQNSPTALHPELDFGFAYL